MEQMASFITAVETDAEFSEEIHALMGDGKIAEVLKVAARKGFPITETELHEHLKSKGKELSEEELKDIAGGSSGSEGEPGSFINPLVSETCWFIKSVGLGNDNYCMRLSCRMPVYVSLFAQPVYICNCHGTSRCRNGYHHTTSACR